MLLAFLVGFVQLNSAVDTGILEESRIQAEYYIQKIEVLENGNDSTPYLLALTELAYSNDDIASFIQERVKNSAHYNNSLTHFENLPDSKIALFKRLAYENGEKDFLVPILLSTDKKSQREKLVNLYIDKFSNPNDEKIDYKLLFKALINKEHITAQLLPANTFYLPHFFLLFDNEYSTYFDEEYLNKIATNSNSKNNNTSELEYAFSQVTYFRSLYILDRYDEIGNLYSYLIEDKILPNSPFKLRIFRYLDYSMFRLGHYDRNLKIARSFTLPLATFLNQEKLILQIKFAMGINLYSIGKIKESIQYLEEVYAQFKNEKTGLRVSTIYHNLALTNHRLGKYDRYLNLQYQAFEQAVKANDYTNQLSVLNNLFIYYRQSGDKKNALEILEKAQTIASQNGSPQELGTLYILSGSFYRKFLQDYNKAHTFFDKAKKLLNKKNDSRKYFNLLNEQAKTFFSQKKFDESLQNYKEIKLLAAKDTPVLIDALVNIASINLKIGKTNKAKAFISKFKKSNLESLDFEQIIKAKTVEAKYLNETGKPDKALALLEPALEQILRRARKSASLKTGFWHVEDAYLDAFELAVSIYRQEGHPEKAILLLDQLKTINDASIYQNELVKSQVLSEKELTQYKRITEQLDHTRKKLLTASENEQFDIQQTINQLNLKKRKLDEKLGKRKKIKPVSIREIQSSLSGRELVMHITELKDHFYLSTITRNKVRIDTIRLDSTFQNLLTYSIQQVATNKTDLDSLYAISKRLRISDIPEHINKITIIPDSYLYQLPVDILPLHKPKNSYSYGSTTYLIDNFNTRYLSSLNDFKTERKLLGNDNTANVKTYSGYGVSNFDTSGEESLVPLPYAPQEVATIADRLTNVPHVKTFINDASSKSTFTEMAPGADVLHLATHSQVSERDPMFSTIYLTQNTQKQDAKFQDQLFAYELFDLDLDNELIMLNSCESGSGDYIQGAGVMGISRALQYAGAKSLVLNLWSVKDKLASDFAVHFYEELNEGKSKTEALKNTKQYFLQNKNADPHYWGPYMLIGNSDPITNPQRDKNLALSGIFILYFLLIVGLSYLKERNILFSKTARD